MLADDIISFYRNLNHPKKLPAGIQWLYPQQSEDVMRIVELFYYKYYDDEFQRKLIFGINPGRHGAGTTGVNFTGPRQLKQFLGIDHNMGNSSELSAEFIYDMINAYGGPEAFYHDFIISAVSPLGFVITNDKGREVNINYYDDRELMKSVTPFIIDCINKQASWNVNRDKCFCIGGDKNLKFLKSLNDEHKWFKEIIPLPHPRFIMQYRRKLKDQYIQEYLDAFK